jgi:hypothetical protein
MLPKKKPPRPPKPPGRKEPPRGSRPYDKSHWVSGHWSWQRDEQRWVWTRGHWAK